MLGLGLGLALGLGLGLALGLGVGVGLGFEPSSLIVRELVLTLTCWGGINIRSFYQTWIVLTKVDENQKNHHK